MGGTTAKLSLIVDGTPQTIREFELHEDLLSTLGLDRESEATSAEAC